MNLLNIIMHGHRINEIYKLAGKEDKLLEIETEMGKLY